MTALTGSTNSGAGAESCPSKSTLCDKVGIAVGWLHFHRASERVERNPWLVDVHLTAVIEEKASGESYAVDSWFGHNGDSPHILPLGDWLRKQDPD